MLKIDSRTSNQCLNTKTKKQTKQKNPPNINVTKLLSQTKMTKG